MTNASALLSTRMPGSSTLQKIATEPPASLQTASTLQARKLFTECQKFEGILIANLWGEMERGIGLSGPSTDPGSDTMQGFGIQAAAMGIASAGGLGIAQMLYRELAPSLRQNQGGKANR